MSARTQLELGIYRPDRSFLHRSRAPRAVSQGVEADVRRDAIKPGFQRGTAIEPIEAAPGAHHRLLNGILCVEGRPQHSVTMARKGGAMELEIDNISGGHWHILVEPVQTTRSPYPPSKR